MTVVNIMSGGPKELLPANWKDFEGIWIGVDYGAVYLNQNGIVPEVAIGDFDTAGGTPIEFNSIHRSIPEKDDTDTELALESAMEFNPDQINIFSATGGRLDHELANLLFLAQKRFASIANKVVIWDKDNIINFYSPGKYVVPFDGCFKYIGFMSLTSITNLSIIGAKYELKNYDADYPRMFTSNEFMPQKDIELSFDSGTVMQIKTN